MANIIPSYELYGELLAGELPGPIHHETIRERSSKHEWTIRLHRHRHLAQIFHFRSTDVFVRVGDIEYTSSDQITLVVPPGVPHGFRFSEDIIGDVVSIRLDEMPATLQQRFAMFNAETGKIFTGQRSDNFDNVAALIDQLRQAYHSIALNREAVLLSLIDLIILYLTGDLRTANSLKPVNALAPRARHDLQIEAFCNLLEENFQHPWTVAQYAQRIGISAPHLTRVCKARLDAPPNNLLRRRRILEAKRLLEYTALSVAEIARRCGFKDAAFFSRTFKASLGIPPHQYRTQLDE